MFLLGGGGQGAAHGAYLEVVLEARHGAGAARDRTRRAGQLERSARACSVRHARPELTRTSST